jgi:putative ABC transport system ATP-binding protein
MIEVDRLRHRYGATTVLALDSWRALAGEHRLILGASGSGKTTLLCILAGLLRPSEGRVEVAGRELARLSGPALDRFRGQHIGFVPQKLHLVASLSVGEAQRVAVARAVVNRPRVIFADEPTSNLDDAHCERTLDLLESQAASCGATLVIATHDQRAKTRFPARLELASDVVGAT